LNITTKTGLVGLLMALATLTAQEAATAPAPAEPQPVIESDSGDIQHRLANIAAALRLRESQLQAPQAEEVEQLIAGWLNGGGGGFVNRAWGNAWPNGGGFLNNRGGGGFLNNRGGGGFVNVR
jgi:rSAM-associated Gly-rich repeat protein